MHCLKNWIALLALPLLLAGCSSSNEPDQVAKSFVEATYEGDVDELISLLAIPKDAESHQKDMVRGKMQMAVADKAAKASRNGGVDKIEIGQVDYNDDKSAATVPVTVYFANGEKNSGSTRLVKMDGDWKVRL